MEEENDSRRRCRWRDSEVAHLLCIVRDKHINELMETGPKRNHNVYDRIAKEMRSKGSTKDIKQIRTKFKLLKKEYCHMRRNKKYSQILNCSYFSILEEIMQHHPKLKAASTGETCLTEPEDSEFLQFMEKATGSVDETENPFCESISNNKKPATFIEKDNRIKSDCNQLLSAAKKVNLQKVDETCIKTTQIKEDPLHLEFAANQESEELTDSSSDSSASFDRTASTSKFRLQRNGKNTKQAPKHFQNRKKNSFASFTKQWRNFQDTFLNQMKEQEHFFIKELKENQAKSMENLERLLEKDRVESAKLFMSIINSANPTHIQNSSETHHNNKET